MNCPLCQSQDCNNYPEPQRSLTAFECQTCGKFDLTAQAMSVLGDNGWKLAAYVWEQNQLGTTPRIYSSQQSLTQPSHLTHRSLQEDAMAGSVGLDAALDTFPKTVAERLDRALLNLAAITRHLGQQIAIASEGVNPLLLAKNSAEVFFLIRQFELEGYVNGNTSSLPTGLILTAKGLNHAADLQRGLFGPLSKQAFVAMSFDKTLDHAWKDGLRPAIADCDCTALRVDAKEHNDKICDVIIAEIRRSKFLVADFTLHRAGVYFEAGLMMGLGRPVIFTCRKDEIDKAHFDTRQYNHIVWENSFDLREKLKRRIQATIVQ